MFILKSNIQVKFYFLYVLRFLMLVLWVGSRQPWKLDWCLQSHFLSEQRNATETRQLFSTNLLIVNNSLLSSGKGLRLIALVIGWRPLLFRLEIWELHRFWSTGRSIKQFLPDFPQKEKYSFLFSSQIAVKVLNILTTTSRKFAILDLY